MSEVRSRSAPRIAREIKLAPEYHLASNGKKKRDAELHEFNVITFSVTGVTQGVDF
jgi:hypothetical protein